MYPRWLGQLTEFAFRKSPANGATWNDDSDLRPKGTFVVRNGKTFAGTHLLVDFFQASNLDDVERMKAALTEAAHAASATLLELNVHRFSDMDGGVSGVAVLAESHISVHTWPAYGFAALDLFMCGSSNPYLAIPVLRNSLAPKKVKVHEFLRGEIQGADMLPADRIRRLESLQ